MIPMAKIALSNLGQYVFEELIENLTKIIMKKQENTLP
jgi:hypothetical protein